MCTSFLCPSPRFSLSAFILNQVFLLKTKSLNPAPSSTTALFFLDKLLKKLNAFHLHLDITFQSLFKQLQCGCHRRFFTTHQLSRKSPKTFISKSNGRFQIKSPQPAWPLGSIHHSWPLSQNTLSLRFRILHSDFPPPRYFSSSSSFAN